MKSLISITEKEIKSKFHDVLDMATEAVLRTGATVTIAVKTGSKWGIHKEVAKVIYIEHGGVKYVYNREVLEKIYPNFLLGKINNAESRIASIILNAIGNTGVFDNVNEQMRNELFKAAEKSAKQVIKHISDEKDSSI